LRVQEKNQFELQSRNNMYHVGIFGYVLMILDCFKAIGVSDQKLTKQSIVNNFRLKNPNRFVPIHVIYDFYEIIGKYFESKKTPEKFFEGIQFCNLGKTGKFINSSSKLLMAFQNLDKYDHYFCTNQSSDLAILGSTSSISNRFKDDQNRAQIILEYTWLCLIKNLLKSVNKNKWDPVEVHFSFEKSAFTYSFLNKATPVKYNQKNTTIFFKSSLLLNNLVKKGNCEDYVAFNKTFLQKPPVDLSSKIEHILENNRSSNLPTLQSIAELFGVSQATFKRHLALENTNYKELINRWRLNNSVSLLMDTDKSIIEISEKLYYTKSANFIRAFKKWTGHTPMNFRQSE